MGATPSVSKIARADDVGKRLARGVAVADANHGDVVGGHHGKGATGVAHFTEAAIREGAIPAFGRAVVAVEADDVSGCAGARHGAEQEAVDKAEDAGVDANAKREHADGGEREAWMAEEQPDAVAEILQHAAARDEPQRGRVPLNTNTATD